MGIAVAQLFVAFSVHRYFLKGEDVFSVDKLFSRRVGANQKGSFKFVMVALLLVLGPILLALPLVIGMLDRGTEKDVVAILLVLVMMPLYWVSLGVFGTVLPAIVDKDPRYRLVAGMKKTPVMMMRLLIGPAMMGIVFFASGIGLSIAINALIPMNTTLWDMILSVVASVFSLFNMILAVATLCSVYRMTVPASEGVSS